MSTRRDFITLLGGAASWPLAARAQQSAKLPTIGFLGAATPSAWSDWVAAFVKRLRELGWIEGRTVAIEYRWGEGRNERFAEIAAEFIRLKVDVIVTSGVAALAVKQATSVIPIVFAVASDPVGAAWSRAWRNRAATSPACRPNLPIPVARSLKSCARLSRASAGWQSLAMLATPVVPENSIRGDSRHAGESEHHPTRCLAILHLLWAFVANLFKSPRRLEVENLFLRHQINIAMRGAPHRLCLRGSDRALLVWMIRLWPSLLGLSRVVQPDTILRWHRAGFRTYWRWKSRARQGGRR